VTFPSPFTLCPPCSDIYSDLTLALFYHSFSVHTVFTMRATSTLTGSILAALASAENYLGFNSGATKTDNSAKFKADWIGMPAIPCDRGTGLTCYVL
jgi:hypothetical protein